MANDDLNVKLASFLARSEVHQEAQKTWMDQTQASISRLEDKHEELSNTVIEFSAKTSKDIEHLTQRIEKHDDKESSEFRVKQGIKDDISDIRHGLDSVKGDVESLQDDKKWILRTVVGSVLGFVGSAVLLVVSFFK